MSDSIDPVVRDKLVASAMAIAVDRGWTWRDPVDITTGLEAGVPVWIVRSNASMRSPSVRVVLRREDLSVVRSGYLPR